MLLPPKPSGVAEAASAEYAASSGVSLSFINPLMTSEEDSRRGAVTKQHLQTQKSGKGKHPWIKK